jgi:hypothetical protein
MEIKVTAPQEMGGSDGKLQEVITAFEAQMKKQDKDEPYYHLVIVGEYNRQVLDKVEQIYHEAGWRITKAKTSSENGERGGLTGLQLWK